MIRAIESQEKHGARLVQCAYRMTRVRARSGPSFLPRTGEGEQTEPSSKIFHPACTRLQTIMSFLDGACRLYVNGPARVVCQVAVRRTGTEARWDLLVSFFVILLSCRWIHHLASTMGHFGFPASFVFLEDPMDPGCMETDLMGLSSSSSL